MKKNFTIIIFVLVFFGWLIARPYKSHGDCMAPAIKEGQLCFSNQLAPYLRNYKTGDIIFFQHENRLWFSRIVALENDTISIKEKEIIVNGHSFQDTDIYRNWKNWSMGTYAINKPFKVPKNHVFVLSDNLCAKHDDSRVFGPIHNSSIVGLMW